MDPGEPPGAALGRQAAAEFHVPVAPFGSLITNENPAPSVIGYQESLKEKSRIGSCRDPMSVKRSPEFPRWPEKVPRIRRPAPYRDWKAAGSLTSTADSPAASV